MEGQKPRPSRRRLLGLAVGAAVIIGKVATAPRQGLPPERTGVPSPIPKNPEPTEVTEK